MHVPEVDYEVVRRPAGTSADGSSHVTGSDSVREPFRGCGVLLDEARPGRGA